MEMKIIWLTSTSVKLFLSASGIATQFSILSPFGSDLGHILGMILPISSLSFILISVNVNFLRVTQTLIS